MRINCFLQVQRAAAASCFIGAPVEIPYAGGNLFFLFFLFSLTGWLKHAGLETEQEQPRLSFAYQQDDALYHFHSVPNFLLTHFPNM